MSKEHYSPPPPVHAFKCAEKGTFHQGVVLGQGGGRYLSGDDCFYQLSEEEGCRHNNVNDNNAAADNEVNLHSFDKKVFGQIWLLKGISFIDKGCR